jgi:N-acetylglucosaminyldiphosphoundecaprenol N-acetyl-beta-D-mannosaminyltransferase
MRTTINILGVPIDVLTMEQAVNLIEGFLQEGGRRQVVTANAEMIYRAQNNPEFQQILNTVDLVTADGSGVVWAAARLGQPLPERITGIDLLVQLVKLAAEKNYSVYFLGGAPGVAEQAAAKLQETYSNLNILGTKHGYFSSAEEDNLVTELKSLAPNFLFVGLGSPKQEELIARIIGQLPGTVAMGVGGSFDVLSGQISRAPGWMQQAGLEWFYRLVKEPWRWKRMSVLPRFMLKVFREAKVR